MLVNRSCGQVPARKERHTFGSVIESCVLREEEEAPMSCSVGEVRIEGNECAGYTEGKKCDLDRWNGIDSYQGASSVLLPSWMCSSQLDCSC